MNPATPGSGASAPHSSALPRAHPALLRVLQVGYTGTRLDLKTKQQPQSEAPTCPESARAAGGAVPGVTCSELEASEPETERKESWFAGFSSPEDQVTLTSWFQLYAGCCVFNSQTCINSLTSVPSASSVLIGVLHSFVLRFLCAKDCWELGGRPERRRGPPRVGG